ncbi:hypothetical protein GOODEAATRI_015045, partial [Goodea atripinnis]
VSKTAFLTYKGTFSDKHSGKLDTEAGPINVSVEGLGSSKLESFFGKLKKEELDVKKLLKDSSSRFSVSFIPLSLHLIAYSILELVIKKNGHYGWLEMDLSPLADLPQSSRCDLIEKLQEALRDRPTLSYLQIVVRVTLT